MARHFHTWHLRILPQFALVIYLFRCLDIPATVIMAAAPNPLQLQIPRLLDVENVDLPTANDDDHGGFAWSNSWVKPSAPRPDLPQLCATAAPGVNVEWISEATHATHPVAAFANNPGGTCYRNATLTALMNCSPFLNFLAHGKSDHALTG